MKRIMVVTGILSVLLMSGCLTYEITETRIQFPEDSKIAAIQVHVFNIASTDSTPEKVKDDFNELMKDYHGDEFLLDLLDEGIYVKSRNVSVDNGILVGSYSGVVRNLDEIENMTEKQNEWILTLDTDDAELLDTNGESKIVGDQTVIVWSKDQKELYWKAKNKYWDKKDVTSLSPLYILQGK